MIEKLVDFLKKHIRPITFVADVAAMIVAFVLASYLKFDAPTLFDGWFVKNMYYIFAVDAVATFLMFLLFKIYRIMWQYMVVSDYLKMVKAYFIGKAVTVAGFFYIWTNLVSGVKYTRSFFSWMAIYSFIFLGMIILNRVMIFGGYREWRRILAKANGEPVNNRNRVMIIGAGNAAFRLITELNRPKLAVKYNIVALLDDNESKHGSYLGGVKILGGRDKIIELAAELDVDEIFFAVPSATEKTKKSLDKRTVSCYNTKAV